VGPFIAFISFVCSIGNVPMAAALWHGGISFGGVISFIFADLIALPLVLIYRKYYGRRLALRLFFTFYAVMAAAGLVVEGLFWVLGLIPDTVLYWLYRNRARFGGGQGYAIDPVCGMQVQTANAPAHASHNRQTFWFCSDRCKERFEANPERYATKGAEPEGMDEHATAVDPVCGMTVDPATAAAHRHHEGRDFFFCGQGCADAFDADPARYATSPDPTPHHH
jgi:YHS domain-containing protein